MLCLPWISDLVYCSCILDHELLLSNKCEILLLLTSRNCQNYHRQQGSSARGYFAKGMDKAGWGYFLKSSKQRPCILLHTKPVYFLWLTFYVLMFSLIIRVMEFIPCVKEEPFCKICAAQVALCKWLLISKEKPCYLPTALYQTHKYTASFIEIIV